jgi:uncharacterized membrane protein YedE/YeeE
MTVNWTDLTPWSALGGGLLIGLAVAMFVLVNGRIAGISGILGGLLRPVPGERGWRIAFLLGLVAAPLVYTLAAPLPAMRIDAGTGTLIAAGLLVGVGTRYGAGCTSGHGVCGLARGSARSLAAMLAFMGAGFATVFIVRHLLA